MAKRSKVKSVRFPEVLVHLIARSIELHNKDYPGAQMTATQWLLAAVREKLAREDREQRKLGPARYKCDTCKQKFSIEQVALSQTTLDGRRLHFCRLCVNGKLHA